MNEYKGGNMTNKTRPIIVKKSTGNQVVLKNQECAIDSTEAKLAAMCSKKGILAHANRTSNIYIVEED